MSLKLTALAAAAILVATLPAEAYRYRSCSGTPLKMRTNNIPIKYSTNSFPAGAWLDGLNNSVAEFNRNPSNMWYTASADTNGVRRGNGENEVWGSTDQAALQGAPAIAWSYWQCNTFAKYMTEGDVIFDYTSTATNPFEWTPNRSKSGLIRYGGNSRLLQGTAIHEFGHAVGLLHVNTRYNVMGSDFTHIHANGATATGYIGEDTGNGTVFLYGLWSGAGQNLGVVHWRHSGASGEYSTHDRTRIWDANTGALLPATTINGEPGFLVRRGQRIRVEFNLENNGRSTISGAPFAIYVSTNDLITTVDRRLSNSTVTLARDSTSLATRTVTVPTNLALNTNYWMGGLISMPAGTTDGYSSNNASYIPVRVIP